MSERSIRIHTMDMAFAPLKKEVDVVISNYDSVSVSYSKSKSVFDSITVTLKTKSEDMVAATDEFTLCLDHLRLSLNNIIWGYDTETLSGNVGRMLDSRGYEIATAESCTGGLLASLITNTPGASRYFKTGFITYDDIAKVELLGVTRKTLDHESAVSDKTAREMVAGLLSRTGADYGVAVTGYMDSADDIPMAKNGLVFIAVGNGFKTEVRHHQFHSDRIRNKDLAAVHALNHLRIFLSRDVASQPSGEEIE